MSGLRRRRGPQVEREETSKPLLGEEGAGGVEDGAGAFGDAPAGNSAVSTTVVLPARSWISTVIFAPLHLVLKCCLSIISSLFRAGQSRLVVSAREEDMIDALREKVALQYRSSESSHVAALRRLWEVSFSSPCPAEDAEGGIVDERWKEMGWQGPDPRTDIRGGGIFAVENLLYLSDTYPGMYKRLLHKSVGTRSDFEYPFAAGGLNVTFTLVDLLGLRKPWGQAPPESARAFLKIMSEFNDDAAKAFAEIYSVTFELLDDAWLEANASYLQFNVIMAKVKATMFDALKSEEVTSITQLRNVTGCIY